MFFKKIEKKLDEIQRQPNELGRQLDELLESLSKNSTVIDNLAQDKLKKAHIIIGYALDTSRDAVIMGLERYSTADYVAKEMFKQLRTAQKLIGEVIGESRIATRLGKSAETLLTCSEETENGGVCNE